MVSRISDSERNRLFGPFGTVKLTRLTTPWGVSTVAHVLVASRFLEACQDAQRTSSWRPQRIDSYNPRTIRGSSRPSLHGWALAWDLFATPPNVPPPGGVWRPDDTFGQDFAGCFERRGFFWGRRFKRQDWPHLEWPGAPLQAAPAPSGTTTATTATSAATTTPTTDDVEETFVIAQGHNDKGAVQRWQQHLGDFLGVKFETGSKYGALDGDFGPKTTQAVKDAQARLQIRQTGVLDPNTMTEVAYELLQGRLAR